MSQFCAIFEFRDIITIKLFATLEIKSVNSNLIYSIDLFKETTRIFARNFLIVQILVHDNRNIPKFEDNINIPVIIWNYSEIILTQSQIFRFIEMRYLDTNC